MMAGRRDNEGTVSVTGDMFVQHHRDQKLQQYTGSPDRTIRSFKRRLSRGGLDAQSVFDAVQQQLQARGDIPRGGQTIDATIVRVPIQHLTKDEKAEVYQGKTPENWSPKKTVHKDTDARWTTKYKKNPQLQVPPHVNARWKLKWRWAVTPANVDDGKTLPKVVAQAIPLHGCMPTAAMTTTPTATSYWLSVTGRTASRARPARGRNLASVPRSATRPSTAGALPCRVRLRAVAPPGRKDRVRGIAGAQRTCYRAQVRGLQRQAPAVATGQCGGALMAQVCLLVDYPACCRTATARKCVAGTPESAAGRHRWADGTVRTSL
jgi:hypothetical protein